MSRAASLADRAFPEGAQRVDAAMPVKVRELSVRHPHRPAIGRLTWLCRRIERSTGYRVTWPDPRARFLKQDPRFGDGTPLPATSVKQDAPVALLRAGLRFDCIIRRPAPYQLPHLRTTMLGNNSGSDGTTHILRE